MTETFRPILHFSPRSGWMNDPNGMIHVDGVWHLFFQHDPDSTGHGPMHWGHATSTDLIEWTEQPVALYPDALGTCFSGSAVETAEGEIKLFYTAHARTEAGEDHQMQCLVHADRALTEFTSDTDNPVVPNPGHVAFRDPKVIWHDPTKRWVMLVTEGQSIGFYGSDDLKNWTYLSRFGEGHGRHSPGPWECPDLVPLMAPNGDAMWMLIVGLSPGGYAAGSGTQYFLGRFDGSHFTNANTPETELWLDYGRDYYAAQTFFERDRPEAPIAIAWASNWLYAAQTRTERFRGVMSLPRQLRLVQTVDGLRAAAHVPRISAEAIASAAQPGSAHHDIACALEPGEELAISLFGETSPHFIVCRKTERHGSIRTLRAAVPGMNQFEHDYTVDFPWPKTGSCELILFIDRGLAELSAADGLVWITNLFYPANPEALPSIALRQNHVLEVQNG